jgi:hypothetical protein
MHFPVHVITSANVEFAGVLFVIVVIPSVLLEDVGDNVSFLLAIGDGASFLLAIDLVFILIV